MKKIFFVEVEPILNYPPVLSVLNIAVKGSYEIHLCVSYLPEKIKKFCIDNNIQVSEYGKEYSEKNGIIYKLKEMIKIRKYLWNEINKYYEDGDIIWVFSILTLKHLGTKLLNKKYVLHLFELIQDMYYLNKFKLGKINLKKFCQQADTVVVCELNRAYITQTWFELEKLPTVLPNKPYFSDDPIVDIKHDLIQRKLEKLEGKKIILYQGIIDEERPLNNFINAVSLMGKDYEMVIMGRGSEKYEQLGIENLTCIPFVEPPEYLKITSKAYIGILCYVVNPNTQLSKLNSIYCAPNKIFEYAKYGIPMIGNDIPGLYYTIGYNKMGECVDISDVNNLLEAINIIEKNYELYSSNAKKFFQQTDNESIINDILNR